MLLGSVRSCLHKMYHAVHCYIKNDGTPAISHFKCYWREMLVLADNRYCYYMTGQHKPTPKEISPGEAGLGNAIVISCFIIHPKMIPTHHKSSQILLPPFIAGVPEPSREVSPLPTGILSR